MTILFFFITRSNIEKYEISNTSKMTYRKAIYPKSKLVFFSIAILKIEPDKKSDILKFKGVPKIYLLLHNIDFFEP